MIELGCVDIATEVSLLLPHLAYSCKGHFDIALHMMAYLWQMRNTWFVFDPTYPKINMDSFLQFDWTKFYGDVKEAAPVDMPEPLGRDIHARMMCNSDHAGDKGSDALALVSLYVLP